MSNGNAVVNVINQTALSLQLSTQSGSDISNTRDLVFFTPLDYPRPANGEIVVNHLGRTIGTIPRDTAEPLIIIDEEFVRSGLRRPSPIPLFPGRFMPRGFWHGQLTVKNQTDEIIIPCFNGSKATTPEIEPGKEWTLAISQNSADLYKIDYVVFACAFSGQISGMACLYNSVETVTVTNEFRRAAKAYEQRREGNYDLVEASTPPPNREDSTYIRHGEEKVANTILNGLNRDVFRVAVYGVRLIFDEQDKSGFLKTYGGRQDIQDLYIFADSIRIEAKLVFPQTNVYVFCRELSFKGGHSIIDTTPISTEYRSPSLIDGNDGAAAGNITLNIQAFSTDTVDAKHLRAVGGKGQNPDEGGLEQSSTARHLKPISREEWTSFFSHKRRKLMRSALWKIPDPATVDPTLHYMLDTPEWKANITYAEIYNTYKFGIGESERYLVGTVGTKDLPGKGPNGLTPGKPGIGGAGGTLTVTAGNYSAWYRHSDLSGGRSGAPVDFSSGGEGGSPSPAWWCQIEAAPTQTGHHGAMIAWPSIYAHAGDKSGPGPKPDKPQGENGQIVRTVGDECFYAWLTEVNLNVAIQYAKDLAGTGYADEARTFLSPYLTTLNQYRDKIPGVIDALELEAASLTAQAKDYLDAYGNPSGWVPALSLESAVDIYEQVLKSSMQQIYSAYYLEKLWLFKKDKQDAIRNLIKLLSSKTADTQTSLVSTRKSIPKLIDELALLVEEMKSLSDKLEVRAKILLKKADDDAISQQQKEDLAAAFKIAGAVVKAIPLPEPYQAAAGAVGGLLDVTSTFIDNGGDDAAFKALQEQVNAFATESTTALVDNANKSIDAQLKQDSPEIKALEDKAKRVKEAKEGLEGKYADQAGQYNALVEQRKEVLDTRIKVLTGARTNAVPSANLAAKWTKEYQDFEADQKRKLARGTADYLAKEKELNETKEKVATAKEDLKNKKEQLEEQKAKNAIAIKDGIDKVKKIASSVATIGQTVNKLIVSKREINKKFDAALAKLQSTDSDFLNLTRQIKYLDDKKEQIAKSLLQQQTELTQQQTLISKNLVMMNEMRAQLSNTADALDSSALAYVQSASQDAHQQLARFLYYVVKAYEYYTVQPWPESYRDAQKLFESLRKTMDRTDFKFEFDNDGNGDKQQKLKNLLASPDPRTDGGLLKSEEFELLRMVYEKPLRDMGKALASHLMSGAGRLTETPKMIVLGASYLEDLNKRIMERSAAQQIPFSIVSSRQLDQSNERQRIANIQVAFVRCTKIGPELPSSVTFKFIHMGKSIVRANGRLFAFDPEGQAIASDLAGKPVAGQRTAFVTMGGNRRFTDSKGRQITADWVTEAQQPVLRDDALWQPSNTAQANLLSKLLSGSNETAAQHLKALSGFRPGIFSDFLLEVEISPPERKVRFEELRLQLTFEAGSAPSDEMLLCVDNSIGMAIPIEADARDASGRIAGVGRYYAVYNRQHLKGDRTVSIKVPLKFGEYVHAGWLVDGQPEDKTVNPITLGKSAYLTAHYVKDKSAPGPREVAGTSQLITDDNKGGLY